MNNKVEELVDRVRLTPEEIGTALRLSLCVRFSEACNFDNIRGLDFIRVAEAQLNRVLNDEDLALIDREDEAYSAAIMTGAVIPLAEALQGGVETKI